MTCCFFSIGSSQGSEGFEGGAKLAIFCFVCFKGVNMKGRELETWSYKIAWRQWMNLCQIYCNDTCT